MTAWLHSLLFLIGSLGVGLVILGTWMLLLPLSTLQIQRYLTQWQQKTPLSISSKVIHIERWFYRHHHFTGTALLLGSAFTLITLAQRVWEGSLMPPFTLGQSVLWYWLLESMWWFVIISNSAALVFSLFLIVRPSYLKSLETYSNQWIQLEQGLLEPASLSENNRQRCQQLAVIFIFLGAYLALTSYFLRM